MNRLTKASFSPKIRLTFLGHFFQQSFKLSSAWNRSLSLSLILSLSRSLSLSLSRSLSLSLVLSHSLTLHLKEPDKRIPFSWNKFSITFFGQRHQSQLHSDQTFLTDLYPTFLALPKKKNYNPRKIAFSGP